MKQIIVFAIGVFFCSCNSNHINHKIEFKKVGECSTISQQYHMESNIMGERYQFTECLPDNFDEKGYEVNRRGDTLVVSFKSAGERPKTGYTLILDIEANPRYTHILLGSQILAIGEAN